MNAIFIAGYSNQASSRVPSVLDPQHPLLEKNAGFSDPYYAAAFTSKFVVLISIRFIYVLAYASVTRW